MFITFFFRWPPWCWVQCLLLWGASAARLSPNLSMFLLSLSSQVGTKKLSKNFLFEREIKKNALEKSPCFCTCYFIVRGASKPASAVDAGGGALAHLPPLHGGGGAGALPLHPLLPAGHAQIRCWHLPPPPSAPWHPCSENWSQVKDLIASNWNRDNAICSNSSLIA